MVHEVHVVSPAQDHHLFAGRGSFKDFIHSVEGQTNIVLRDQIQNRNVPVPTECKFAAENARSWPGGSTGCKSHYRPDARLVVGRCEGSPASKAMSYDSDPGSIK